MFSYMYDLNIINKYDIGSIRSSSSNSMGQLGSSCGSSSSTGQSERSSCGSSVGRSSCGSNSLVQTDSFRRGNRDLKRSKSVHLMELAHERRPKSHRFWRERRVVGDVNACRRIPTEVRLIDLEAALPHSNYSAWCLSFDGEPEIDTVRVE